jgi:hypothetical protein
MLSDGEILPGTTLLDGGQGNTDGAPGLPELSSSAIRNK